MPDVRTRPWSSLTAGQKKRLALRLFGRSASGREAAAALLGRSVFRQSKNLAELKFIQDPETGKLMGSESEGKDDNAPLERLPKWARYDSEVLPQLPQQTVTPQEFMSIREYTGRTGFQLVNSDLRAGKDGGDLARTLDEAMQPSPIEFETFRGVSAKTVSELTGGDGFQVGQTLSDPAFQSTTTNPNTDLSYFTGGAGTLAPMTVLAITVPEGHPIINVSGSGESGTVTDGNYEFADTDNAEEREVILGRDTQYTVTGVSLMDDKNLGAIQVVKVEASVKK